MAGRINDLFLFELRELVVAAWVSVRISKILPSCFPPSLAQVLLEGFSKQGFRSQMRSGGRSLVEEALLTGSRSTWWRSPSEGWFGPGAGETAGDTCSPSAS